MPTILIVDDNSTWREVLAAYLAGKGFSIQEAANGEEAIQSVNESRPDLIISDLLMPGIDGFELCRHVRDSESLADIPFIFCSGFFPENEQKQLSELLSVNDFFDKPVDFEVLVDAVNRNLKATSEIDSSAVKEEGFSDAHKDLIQSNLWSAVSREREQRKVAEGLAHRLELNLEGFISSVSKAISARDPYTSGHQKRVAMLSVAIGEVLELDESRLIGLKFGALIHDIGKIHIPAEILSKPTALSEIEYEMVKSHTSVGYEILKDIDFPWPIAKMAFQHHERFDGSGYPSGLRGDEACLEARIIALADVVEAISSHRPYRAALGHDKAVKELKANRGKLYDPEVVDAYMQISESFSFDEADKQ